MKIGNWAWLMLAAAPLLTGCGDFWQAPSSGTTGTSYSLSNSGNISLAPSGTGTSTITVAPSNSFTGTVTLSCAVTGPSGAASPTTCALSSPSVSITDTNSQTATLTATAGTTLGSYQITITGVSGSTAETTTVCADVSNTGASCAATATTSGNFYILNNGSPAEIVGDSLVSGTLTPISGSPWSLSGLGTPYSIAIAPDGNFLYVSTESGVYLFSIANGVLGTGVAVDQQDLTAYAIQVDPSSSWLVEAVQTTSGVVMNAINVDPTSGAVVTGVSVGTASYAYPTSSASVQLGQLVISQDGNFAFVALGTGGTVVFPFNSTSGFATGTQAVDHISPVHSGGGALSVAVDPSATPRMFYVGESLANTAGNGGALRAFNYNTIGNSGGLTQATGSPIATGGTAPNFILPVASPDSIYVAAGAGSSTAGNIASFAVSTSGTTYSLAAGPTTAVGIQPVGLAEDATGSFLLEVGSLGSPYFDSFTFDATTTGKLDTVVTSTSQVQSIAIVAAPPSQ